MSDIISFDDDKLADVSAGAASLLTKIDEICSNIREQVNSIRSNWSGEEFEKANIDLQKIESTLTNLLENCNSIKNTISTTANNFSQVKYRG